MGEDKNWGLDHSDVSGDSSGSSRGGSGKWGELGLAWDDVDVFSDIDQEPEYGYSEVEVVSSNGGAGSAGVEGGGSHNATSKLKEDEDYELWAQLWGFREKTGKGDRGRGEGEEREGDDEMKEIVVLSLLALPVQRYKY